MAETKKITTLYVVVDSENYYDQIGDIDGGLFDSEWLKSHIRSYGASGLLKKLAFMNKQICETFIEVENENQIHEEKEILPSSPAIT